jgi:DHA1 family multidrug resistance protein-like MFS transporter
MGINASYMSIGQILGPIVGGAVAMIAIPYPFLAGSFALLLCFALSFHVLKAGVRKEFAL